MNFVKKIKLMVALIIRATMEAHVRQLPPVTPAHALNITQESIVKHII